MRTIKLCITILFFSTYLLAEVKVSNSATSGNGTLASPWTGWDTAINFVADTQYKFSCEGAGAPGRCYFGFVDSPNFMKPGIALVGEAGVVLLHTGVGNAVVFDSPSWVFNVRMENFIIQGNAGTTNGILARGLRRGNFKNISVRDVTEWALRCEACVTNIFDNIGVSAYEQTFLIRPKGGVLLTERAGTFADGSTTNILTNLVVEAVGVQAWSITGGSPMNQIIGGTSEGGLGKGGAVASQWNRISGHWFELNAGVIDLSVQNRQNIFENIISTGDTRIDAGGQNIFTGGRYKNFFIHPYAHMTQMSGLEWTGTLQDQDDIASTIRIGNVGPAAVGGYQLSAKFSNTITILGALQHGTIVNTNCVANSNFAFNAFEHFTLANPINAWDGQRVTWRIGQGNAGGWLITYGSKFRAKPGAVFPVLSVTPGAYDYITAVYNQQRNTWDLQ